MLISLLGLSAVATSSAKAGESPFGFIYTLDLQPKGTFQLEQWLWLQQGQSQGTYTYLTPRTEIEYGVLDWYQVGLYLNGSYVNAKRNGVDGLTGGPGTDLPSGFDPTSRYRRARFESVSMENVVRLLNPYTDPVGLGVYIEPTIGPYSRELETKFLFQKNFLDDRLVLAANVVLGAERDSGSGGVERASIIDTLVGVSYRFADNWAFGIEGRNHREFSGYRFANQDHSAYFLGPTLHFASKNFWVTAAWRHQLPIATGFNEEQREVIRGGRIYGDEHARDEIMFRIGFPFATR